MGSNPTLSVPVGEAGEAGGAGGAGEAGEAGGAEIKLEFSAIRLDSYLLSHLNHLNREGLRLQPEQSGGKP
ncbi:MAG: hypothetical protein RIB93_26930 [Coleofasciculus sp. D1-CHI-01]|uniref:hypothetical protein n=1 Tax=Coleofasciculus sp. D1-CHI-01 TaxID=3068482 RepID=UPI0033020BF5